MSDEQVKVKADGIRKILKKLSYNLTDENCHRAAQFFSNMTNLSDQELADLTVEDLLKSLNKKWNEVFL